MNNKGFAIQNYRYTIHRIKCGECGEIFEHITCRKRSDKRFCERCAEKRKRRVIKNLRTKRKEALCLKN